mgnify:CR=1 FL=1
MVHCPALTPFGHSWMGWSSLPSVTQPLFWDLIEGPSGVDVLPRRDGFFNNGSSIFRPMSSQKSEIVCTCQECGFSLAVPREAAEAVDLGLSLEDQARIVLEDHGWPFFTDPPLCSSCNSDSKTGSCST